MVAPLCWEPDLKAVKTAEPDFKMDSLITIATLYSIRLIELFDNQDESNDQQRENDHA
jgi:hypothetical protein